MINSLKSSVRKCIRILTIPMLTVMEMKPSQALKHSSTPRHGVGPVLAAIHG